MKKYEILILPLVLIILSLLIGNVKIDKLKIVSTSIPNIVKKGETFNIEVNTNLDINNIKYASSNNNVLSITNGGLIIPVSKGEATLTVYYEKENERIFDNVKINVTEWISNFL